jgi:hypothetical protein
MQATQFTLLICIYSISNYQNFSVFSSIFVTSVLNFNIIIKIKSLFFLNMVNKFQKVEGNIYLNFYIYNTFLYIISYKFYLSLVYKSFYKVYERSSSID